MPSYAVETRLSSYQVIVERGLLHSLATHIPGTAGKLFVVTTEDVWQLHGATVASALSDRPHEILYFPGGEERKRMAEVEALADRMVAGGADRASLVIAFGGGIVGDVAGFLAAIFMRGIPVLQVPTTLLAQVDAAIGGKTGVNLVSGKNLAGAFHQPAAVLVDPELLRTLPEREYRAGLFEVLKYGVIRSPELFHLMADKPADVLGQKPEVVDRMIAESVRIKAEVVSADEKESDLRRILNFGHTLGHALEAETGYARFLHGEAVAFGMRAAVHLGQLTGRLNGEVGAAMCGAIARYGPIPSLAGISAESLVDRLRSDKKTLRGKVHFVLPEAIGKVTVVSGIDEGAVLAAARSALA